MELAYQTHTKQYNDHDMRNSIWNCNMTCKHYSCRIWYCSCFRRYLTVHVFCKILKKYTPNALWIRLVSVLVGFLFDMQISLILKFNHYLCENFGLLAEAKCHAVWKMIVYSLFAKPMCGTCQKHNLGFKCHANDTQLHTTLTATSNWINITSRLRIFVFDTSWNTRLFFKINSASALMK